MLLSETDHYRLHRRGRFLWAALKRPHRVLSTCKVNGGLREDLSHVANHQSCEGVAHLTRYARNQSPLPGLDAFHAQACLDADLPPAKTALMSTAANMQCAVLAQAEHEDLVVSVAATAGVLGNATRAGDPAGWHEYRDGSRPILRASGAGEELETKTKTLFDMQQTSQTGSVPMHSPDVTGSGTIVLLVLINQPCTAPCLVRAATLVTEAKSAALLDLRMPSLQSPGLATGTGTDQLVIAAPLPGAGDWERNWAGGHNSLGELLGRAVHAAVSRCLLLQNGVCAELRRSVCSALRRHGCDETMLLAQAEAELEQTDAELFAHNLTALIHDPQTAAVAYALAEIVDLARAGVLHAEVAQEAIFNQAALLAAAVAVAPELFPALREALQCHRDLAPGVLAARAVALGFAHKWR
jgi:adenosylcobinamide amidohydrolase